MKDYQLVRFEDKGGKLKAEARQAAKAAGEIAELRQKLRDQVSENRYLGQDIARLQECQVRSGKEIAAKDAENAQWKAADLSTVVRAYLADHNDHDCSVGEMIRQSHRKMTRQDAEIAELREALGDVVEFLWLARGCRHGAEALSTAQDLLNKQAKEEG